MYVVSMSLVQKSFIFIRQDKIKNNNIKGGTFMEQTNVIIEEIIDNTLEISEEALAELSNGKGNENE